MTRSGNRGAASQTYWSLGGGGVVARSRGTYPTTAVTPPGINKPTKSISATNTAATSAHSGAKFCFTEHPHSSTHMLSPLKGAAIGGYLEAL